MFIEQEKYEKLQNQYKDLANEHKQMKDFYEGKYLQMQHELDQLKKLIFGSKSERFIPAVNPQQAVLPFGETSTQAPQVVEKTIKVKEKRSKQEGNYNHNGRSLFPESLPREVVEIEPEEDVEGCTCIGVEVTETLNLTPAKLVVNRYERKKYIRKNAEGIAIGPLPERPIERLMAETPLLAQIILDKYLDHLPLNRQIERYKRLGLEIPVSTMVGWIKAVSDLVAPLLDVHQKKLLKSIYLMADETTIKVLDGDKKGKTHLGYYWVFFDPLGKQVLFVYQPGRSGEYPAAILQNFKGYLQSDGYAGYHQFSNWKDIGLLGCMAHARRKFIEAEKNDRERHEYAVKVFAELYTIEADLRSREADFDTIKKERAEKSRPILTRLKKWLIEEISKVLPKSPIGTAIKYTLERFDKLEAYLEDGRLQIDNNAVERALRPVAIGRKNYLFAGSHQAASRAATFYSLLGTCKVQGIDPMKYLIYILNNIASHPVNKLEELLPENLKSQL